MHPHDTTRYRPRSKPLRRWYKSFRRVTDIRPQDLMTPSRTCEIYRVLGHTMLPFGRLRSAHEIMTRVESERIPGSVVECGVWAGGCIGLMAGVNKRFGNKNRVFHLFDSFEGLPQPSVHDDDVIDRFREVYPHVEPYSAQGDSALVPIGACYAPLDIVKQLFFERLRIDPEQVRIHVGWFQETVPAAREEIDEIAVLRLDGDWYESTRVCIEELYDLVVPGGFIIVDDYGSFSGCGRAIDEFLRKRDLSPEIHDVDGECVWIRKE